MPDPRVAPNYRWALEEYSAFEAEYIDPTVAMVAPREGAGVVRDFLELEFLCDRRTDLGAASTFTPVRERPPEQRYGIDTEAGRAALAQLGEGDERLEAVLAAIRVSTTLNAHSGTLEEFLRSQAGGNFETLPNSSYWYLSVDPVMLSRAAFFRSQLAMKLTPDLVDDAVERETLRGVTDLTLSKGVHYVDLVRPALLVSSPRFNGLLLPAMPHAVVMMTGEPLELRKPWPASAAQLFEPGLFNEAESRVEPLIAGLAPDDCNDLVGWWSMSRSS